MNDILFYLVKKLLMIIPVLLGITIAAFILGIISPSDPAAVLLNMDGVSTPSAQEIANKRHEMGLDRPLIVQYLSWLLQILHGDLGISYITQRPIWDELMLRLPVTISLASCTLLLVIVTAIPLGVFMAYKNNSRSDFVLRTAALIFTSVPAFWLAILFMWIFSEELHLLPTSGYGTLAHLIMPSVALGAGTIGILMRLQRAALLEVLEQHFILTAKAKGMPFPMIIWKHGLLNSLIPVITLLGNYFGAIISGSAVIESIFSLPGLGSYVLEAIRGRDYPAIQGYVIFTGLVFVLFNLLVDISYLLLNPKIRLGGK